MFDLKKPPVPNYNKELEFLDSLTIIGKDYKQIVDVNFFGSGKYGDDLAFEKAVSLMKWRIG